MGNQQFNRIAFYRLEKKHKFPGWDKDHTQWRRYNREEADFLIGSLLEIYRMSSPVIKPTTGNFVMRFFNK